MKKNLHKRKIVKSLKISESLGDKVAYYCGEVINGIPDGNGFSETYDINELNFKVHKKVEKKWINNYQKSFLIKKNGHNLDSKFIGEWKLGSWNGKGKLIEYYGPEYFINKDGSPKISGIFEGNFVNGEKKGQFKEFMDTGSKGVWKKKVYK